MAVHTPPLIRVTVEFALEACSDTPASRQMRSVIVSSAEEVLRQALNSALSELEASGNTEFTINRFSIVESVWEGGG